jgi:hypothetical protein
MLTDEYDFLVNPETSANTAHITFLSMRTSFAIVERFGCQTFIVSSTSRLSTTFCMASLLVPPRFIRLRELEAHFFLA